VRARPQILALVEDAMAEARAARPLGDQTEELVARALAPTRYAAVAAGARLARAGRLAEPEAVFLLRPDELAQALRGEPITADVERRLAEFRWALSHRGPPRYGPAPTDFPGLRFVPRWARPFLEVMRWVLPRVAPPAGTPPSDTGTLQGIAASPGRAAGRVRIVVSPGALSRIEPGDVLVAPSAWAEWSVAFPLIRALITERGGALSHPAILAREFGIPAVLNVAEATERLREGERVVVDGTTGTVRRESS
jgi:pyruvate,water dikinase